VPSSLKNRIRVVPYRHHPKLRWTIAGYSVGGKRVRRFFPTKSEAETFVHQLNIRAENLGTQAAQVNQALYVETVQCNERLKPYGKSLTEATDFFIQYLEAVNRSCTVEQLIELFIADRQRDGVSLRTAQEFRSRLGQFKRAFAGRNVATIESIEVDDWLRSLGKAPLTRNNTRRVLHVMFAYALARKFCRENPISQIAKAKVIAEPVEVLTPEETRRLLEKAAPQIVPALAIGAFAGLRPAEISRLDWKEVRLDRGFIEVTAKNAKTATRRLVTIQPNLRAWLEPHVRKSGPVVPTGDRILMEAARRAAGFEKWPSNALRHSYASYHLAKFQDAAALALQMGHSTTAMIFAHYREVVTPDSADAYWTITPGG
jgi:integrase